MTIQKVAVLGAGVLYSNGRLGGLATSREGLHMGKGWIRADSLRASTPIASAAPNFNATTMSGASSKRRKWTAEVFTSFSRASIPSCLFDLTAEIASAGLKRAREIKPAAFYHARRAKLIQPEGLDTGLEKIKECDWILEVVTEKLDLKRGLYERILPHVKPGAFISSNTSGISLKVLADSLPAERRRRFFITHFFNPPRYLQLCEVVSPPEADGAALAEL